MVSLMAVLQISAAILLGFAQHAGVGGCADVRMYGRRGAQDRDARVCQRRTA